MQFQTTSDFDMVALHFHKAQGLGYLVNFWKIQDFDMDLAYFQKVPNFGYLVKNTGLVRFQKAWDSDMDSAHLQIGSDSADQEKSMGFEH